MIDGTTENLASTAWRTLTLPRPWARDESERCINCLGLDRRCMLREGHAGTHTWRTRGALRVFEWT
jgi:hypothetical protein